MSAVLTQDHTLERAQLEIKKASGGLSKDDAFRLKLLQVDGRPAPSHTLSLGSRAATSHTFKNLAVKGISPNVPLSEDVRLTGLRHDEFKALITGASDTSAGAFVTNIRGGAVQQPRRRLTVLDLALVGDTTADAVTYARQSAFTNAAAVVTEATSTAHGTKPEATIAFSVETAVVEDYATWVPVTRRSLSDVGELRQTIDSQLTYAVRRKLEEVLVAAMVSGAGSTQAKAADTLFVATLKLLTTLRNLDVEPTGILLNPVDYEALRTVTTAYSSPPITVDADGTERLFSIPLIVTPSVADDTAVVADMRSVAVWLRSLDIFVSDSHSDWFTKNLSAVLAELRAAAAVVAPAGIGTVTGWD